MQLSKCKVCKKAFQNSAYPRPIALFFEMRSDSQLLHPNYKLYAFLRYVEHLFQNHHTSSNDLELVITDILEIKTLTFPCMRKK